MNQEPTMTLGARICALRKAQCMTQEQLAEKLGVTFQAVSKWENEIACPDVLLLPAIADIFGVSIDELFGRAPAVPAAEAFAPAEETPPPMYMDGLPWPDDGNLYAVVCKGHTLLSHLQLLRRIRERQEVRVVVQGEAVNVTSDFAVEIHGNVNGDVKAGDAVVCADVAGSVTAGDGVDCGNVGGNVHAGDGVRCGGVGGSVDAGDSIHCEGDIGGDVRAGDGVRCGSVGGNVHAGDGITCGDVHGSVLHCDTLRCTGIRNGQ